tara:strand:- start:546 stop:1586 length:1041 start_codon:yes stop_codon:yes gene_type:complete
MKILLPYIDLNNHSINHPQVTGGSELFCRHLVNNFDTYIPQIPIEALNYNLKEKNAIVQRIIEEAITFDVDIIVSNFSGSIFAGHEITTKSPIPLMVIEHCIYPMLTVIAKWNNVVNRGHSVFFVSKAQEMRYQKMADRSEQSLYTTGHYIRPSYCHGEKSAIQDVEYDCMTIGRSYKGKDPFKLHRFLKDTDLRRLVISSRTDYDDQAYYEKNKHWDHTIWDQPYDVVMDTLGKAATYFSTCEYETWGITALEALSHGVPIILSSDKDIPHASEVIVASPRHYRRIPKGSASELIQGIQENDLDRQEVQDMTWEKHSEKAWRENFETAAQMTIDKFNKHHNSLFG